METLSRILELDILSVGKYSLKIYSIFNIILIVLITKMLLWFIKKTLFRNKHLPDFDEGNTFALLQITKYFIWIIAFGLVLESLEIKITVLLAGSAALLVGVGLGLQRTFNDFVSGIILLLERSIKVGDILEIDESVVKIKKIGLRTSDAIDRDDISIILPNSAIINNKVINWSHQSKKTRFRIFVGVAYGSDVDLVVKILTESALEHPQISDKKLVNARLINFGNSSLDFEVLFFSENVFRVENIKSDIRKIINRKLIENHITIPFPQMDVHINSEHSKTNL